MFDFESIMSQAKEFQDKFKEDLQKMAVTASSGGGAVKVVVNGSKELTNIEFSAEALQDPEILADMVLAAMNGAYAEVDQKLKDRMPDSLGSFDLSNLPPSIMDMFKK